MALTSTQFIVLLIFTPKRCNSKRLLFRENVSKICLGSFGISTECFRIYPTYDTKVNGSDYGMFMKLTDINVRLFGKKDPK